MLSRGPEELKSTVESCLDGSANVIPGEHAIVPILASQFMAAITENPASEDLVREFADCTFAAKRLKDRRGLYSIVDSVRNVLLSETDAPIARVASPIRLTDFGVSANKTGFSPQTCRRILSFLRSRESLGADNFELMNDLLVYHSAVSEQTNENFRKVVQSSTSKFRVKPSDLRSILSKWLQGDSHQAIFLSLPKVVESKSKVPISSWGHTGASSWDSEFDKFMDFCSTVLENFLPWILRACAWISTEAPGWASSVDWRTIADFVEEGVNSPWAIAAKRSGAPPFRKALVIVGHEWRDIVVTSNDPLGIEIIRSESVRTLAEQAIHRAIVAATELHSVDSSDIRAVQEWLWRRAGVMPPLTLGV
jgi:helicase